MNRTPRIHVLPDLLVNKIAAGEVVERPASVVKELIDNALDAGATRIVIAIEDGGKQLIRVTDDGGGMAAEELRLAVQPHATSKISVEEDLYAIATLGFRGEALASISSVSKMRIVSRLPDGLEGHEIRVAAERLEADGAAGCPAGTTVEVRDLFFNVPARRKFLRAHATEVGHINEQFARAALAWPGIAFELANNGRVTQNLPRCRNRLERIAKFHSEELASALIPVEREERGLTIEAYAAPPAQSRATAQWQYTFVNGRYVRDRYVQHALKEAYRGLMEPNRHGVVFLFLTLDPANVDVNVHPTKIEVRWADANLVHSQVLSGLREAFQRANLTPALNMDRARPQIDPAVQERIRREMAEVFKATAPVMPGGGSPPAEPGADLEIDRHGPRVVGIPGRASTGMPSRFDAGRTWETLYGRRDDADEADRDAVRRQPPEGFARPPGPRPRAIQLHNLYLVAETDDGIVIVDQHALHERVMYEQLRQRIAEGPLESQRLLLPETLKVTPQEAAVLERHAELLERLGVEVTPFGRDALAVHAFPALLKDTDVVSFLRDLLDQLAQQAVAADTEAVIHKILDLMACKAAVKAGDPLTDEEVHALIEHRHLVERSSSCPHGRPTMLRLTKAELNRQFKRT